MPALEEALEELRMSLIDHAYDLLKCLDIDELSSDDIRRKLEVYNIKFENMSSDWLPNGRFYRMYPSIKHHRTRYDTIKSIVASGGQFEGVWSDSFSNKAQFNYSSIQLLRHYKLGSDQDGYFYISGDTSRSLDGSIASSAIEALSSDILLSQALPAGYTYIYVPWPRPHYPSDSGYFYNVHMLQFDRLHYSEDCNYPYSAPYDTSVPASNRYYSKFTVMQPPYWYDYHYIGTDTHPNVTSWPIKEIGYYCNDKGTRIARLETSLDGNSVMMLPTYDGDITLWETPVHASDSKTINSIYKKAVKYELDESCSYLGDPASNWISNCYLHTRYKTSEPNRKQQFTPFERIVLFDNVTSKDVLKSVLESVFSMSSSDAIKLLEKDVVYVPLKIEDCDDEYLKALKDRLDSTANVSISSHSEDGIDELAYSIAGILNNREYTPTIKSAILADDLQTILNLAGDSVHTSDIVDFIKKVPKSPVILYDFDKSEGSREAIASLLSTCYNIDIQTAKDKLMLDTPIELYSFQPSQSDFENGCKDAFTVMEGLRHLGCTCTCSGYTGVTLSYSNFSYSIVKNSIDENCLIEPNLEFSPKAGAYKFDRLTAGLIHKVNESIHHIKTYKPVWDVPSPVFEMSQSDWQPAEYEVTITNATSAQAETIANNIYTLIGKSQSDTSSIAEQIYAKQPLPIVDSRVIDKLLSTIIASDPVNHSLKYNCIIKNLIIDAVYFVTDYDSNREQDLVDELSMIYAHLTSSEISSMLHNVSISPIRVTSNEDISLEQAITNILNAGGVVEPKLKSVSNRSLYYWTELKQQRNVPALTECMIATNEPPVSSETFTSFDKPTVGRLDPIYTAFFRAKPDEEEINPPKQDSNYTLSDTLESNKIYYYNNTDSVEYDPTLYYSIMNVCKDDSGNETVFEDSSIYVQGDPATKQLYINKNNQDNASYNCITYKTSKVHKMWFSRDKLNHNVVSTSNGKLYNSVGKTGDFYHFTNYNVDQLDHNTVYIKYKVIGVYKEDGTKVEGGNPTIMCILHGVTGSADTYEYVVTYGNDQDVYASYILFTVEVGKGEVKKLQSVEIINNAVYHQAVSVVKVTDIGEAEWHYAPPSISGGEYSSTNFNTEHYISGGSYSDSSFDVEHYINGNLYNSSEFDVE